MKFKEVKTAQAPAPIGPYSQAMMSNVLMLTSGQIALDPKSGKMREGIDAEVEQVFANLEAVLTEAGLSFADVMHARVYLIDLADFPKVNAAMEKHFSKPYPARTTIQVSGLPKGAKVEVELVAANPHG